jgi:PAS domain S-box-containing protein
MTTAREFRTLSIGPRRFAGLTPRRLAFILAVLLPVVSSAITTRFAFFHPFPFALDFLSMAFVATLGGLAPAMLALLVTILSHGYLLLSASHPSAVGAHDIPRLFFLFSAALIISLLGDRSRRNHQQLESTVTALQESNAALVETLNGSKCASWTLDLDTGRSARWHSGSYPVFGRPFEEVEALQSLASLVHPDDRPELPLMTEQMRTTWEPIVFEFRAPWPNGELHWLEMRATRVVGKPCVWRGVTLDITERKLAEAALLRAEKLAAMGRLASTVAHEINNPLEAVTNLLYLANADPVLADETRAYLATAETELSRLGNITRLTLGFVRNNGVSTTVELSAIVDDVLSIFRHRLDTKSVTVERHYTDGVCVQMAPHELRQIVTNLVANAADAVSPPEARIAIHIRREGPHAVLLVDDNGAGIAEPYRARIFEPFFSTKEEVGTGIGLWVTRELVEKNGGRVLAETRDLPAGFHTRFRIELPLAAIGEPQRVF